MPLRQHTRTKSYKLGASTAKPTREHNYAKRTKYLSNYLSTIREDVTRVRRLPTFYDESELFEEEQSGIKIKGSAAKVKQENLTIPLPEGCTWENCEHPFLIDKFPSNLVDGTAWKDELNERLDAAGFDYLPHFPFVCHIVGGINSGKTNVLLHMLYVLIHVAKIQNLLLVAPTAKMDPSLAALRFERSPDTKVQLYNQLPFDILLQQAKEVIQQMDPVMKASELGHYPKLKENKAVLKLLPPSSLHMPHRDVTGELISSEPRIPPDLLIPNAKYDSFWFKKAKNKGLKPSIIPYGTLEHTLQHPEKFRTKIPLTMRQLLFRMNADPMQGAFHEIEARFKKTGQKSNLEFEDKPFHDCTLVVDDPQAYFADSYTKQQFVEFVLRLRHNRSSAFIATQRLKLLPAPVRAQVTHCLLFAARGNVELEAICEEFGSKIPNFEEVYRACTFITEECPRPFMYINLNHTPPLVMRCFDYEVKYDVNAF